MDEMEQLDAAKVKPVPAPTADPTVAQSRKLRLLQVDDDSAMCDLMRVYFEHFGFEVTSAHSASAGSALIAREPYDLAILDWKLDGGANGLDLASLSKALHPEVPVIIFTGAEDDEALLRKAAAGRADSLIRKTGSLAVLSMEVLRQFARARKHPAPARPQGTTDAHSPPEGPYGR